MRWINLGALNWALEYDVDSTEQRIVLFELAYHSDARGYTWPSVKFIASTWHLHRDTVARAIDALIVRRAISRTKKRRGKTRQVKVYRMPKITWGSAIEIGTLKRGQSASRVPAKCLRSTIEIGTNKEEGKRNNKRGRGAATLCGSNSRSLPDDSASAPSFVSLPIPAPLAQEEEAWMSEVREEFAGANIEKEAKKVRKYAEDKGIAFTREC